MCGAAPRPAVFRVRESPITVDADRSPSRSFVNRTLTVLGLASLVLAIWLLLWNALEIFLLAFIALLLAVALATPAAAIASKTRMPHWLALGLIALALVGAVLAGIWFAGEALVAQLVGLLRDLPQILERAQSFLERAPGGGWLLEQVLEAEPADVADIGTVGQVAEFLGGMVEILIRIVFVVFLALFLAAAPARYRGGIVSLFPPSAHARAREVFAQLTITIQGWILGQLASMLLVGILATTGLLIIGVQYALILGLIAGLAELIPIFGPVFAYFPAVLVALAEGPQQALWVTGLYLLIQQLEGNAIQPMVQRFAVDLPPALTVVAVLGGGALFGPIGLFIGTPLVAIVLVLIKMLYVRDVHGQPIELPGGQSEG
jgi:predicted PurR-regulated permease PerM